jgi:hypothetical protein
MLYIDVINQTTMVEEAMLKEYCAAIQKQVRDHFAPIWGVGYYTNILVRNKPLANTKTARHMTVYILNDSDEPGALGYHDTDEHNNPLGKVFAKTDVDNGLSVSVTMSHEILEMIGDFWCRGGYQVNPSTWAASEVCDPPEADQWGYMIDGVLVSDFVTPEYFITGSDGPYDYMEHIRKPLQLLRGGYISLWSQSTGWIQQVERIPGVQSRSESMGRHAQRQFTMLEKALLPVQDS